MLARNSADVWVPGTIRIGLVIAVWTMVPGGPAHAQVRSVTGQFGVLGEWVLSATVVELVDHGGRWVGPLNLKHIGYCGVDGPQEKTGELRLKVSDPPIEATATLVIDGEGCTFRGTFKDGYDGVMSCPNGGNVTDDAIA